MPAGRVGLVWRHEPRGRLHHWHRHDEPEYNLVVRGTARYLLSDRRYDLGPGCLVWLFPEQEHLLVDLSPDLVMWIGIHRPKPLDRAIGDGANRGLKERDPAGHFSRLLAPEDAAFLARLSEDLAGATDNGLANSGLTFLFLTAWERFLRASDLPAGPKLHPAVERAAALLAEDPGADLGAVAVGAGLSQWRLSRLFHQQVGQTLVAFRARRRVQRFLNLRREQPERTMLALALDAGFGSYAQFHRAFRSAMGVGPGRYVE
jgi:AraC-like DNA-binding protein